MTENPNIPVQKWETAYVPVSDIGPYLADAWEPVSAFVGPADLSPEEIDEQPTTPGTVSVPPPVLVNVMCFLRRLTWTP